MAKPKTKDVPYFTLIIWEEHPETIKLVFVPNDILTPSDLDVLRTAHGHYINTMGLTEEQEIALNCINNALTDDETSLAEEHPKGSLWAMRFASFIHKGDEPIEKMVSRVFQMGFIC